MGKQPLRVEQQPPRRGQGDEKMENLVFHYTKMDALPKIFLPKECEESEECKESKKCKEGNIKLRFTNIRYLNDKSEGLVFKNFFEKYKKEIFDNLPKDLPENLTKGLLEEIFNGQITEDMINFGNKYVLSTSNLIDSFVFWNKEYAGLDGVAIIFDEGRLLKLENSNFLLRDITYVSLCDKEGFIKDIASNIFGNFNIEKALGMEYSSKEISLSIADIISCIYKHKAWEHEKEMRMVKIVSDTDADVDFNNNKVSCFHYEYFDKSVVRAIMLGPECNDEQVKAIKKYLDKNGYTDIRVGKSRAYEFLNSDKL
ncbi:MAG: DUF2971 domain-containing protein [Fibromonadaceae bacterium]|jgi:hypothetical protein|nr:DUF2971 domain-containing protein [Fibromonadaceae bacterium]